MPNNALERLKDFPLWMVTGLVLEGYWRVPGWAWMGGD